MQVELVVFGEGGQGNEEDALKTVLIQPTKKEEKAPEGGFIQKPFEHYSYCLPVIPVLSRGCFLALIF